MAQVLEAVFHQGDQRRIDFIPVGADVVCGEVVDLGGFGGVCTSPEGIADGVLGSLDIDGMYRFKKDGTAGPVFARGDWIVWDVSANLAIAVADIDVGDFVLARCIKAAGANEDGVYGVLVYGQYYTAP